MRIGITGSSGLIGSVLIERLRARGDDPVPVDLRTRNRPINILDRRALEDAVSGADGVVHLAAVSRVAWGESHPDLCEAVNVEGTARVLEALKAAEENRWVVHASSREVYGDAAMMLVTEDAPKHPVNRYGRSKLASEKLVEDAAGANLRVATLRLSSVYGGRQDHPDRAIPSLTWRALQQAPLVITGAKTYFDFVHVEDTVDGILAAIDVLATERKSLPPINLATGAATNLRELAEMILAVTGSEAELAVTSAREFDVSGYCGSPVRARTLLGWEAQWELMPGITQVAEDFRRSGPLTAVPLPIS